MAKQEIADRKVLVRHGVVSRLRRACRDAGHGLLIAASSLFVGVPLFVASVASFAYMTSGIGFLLAPFAMLGVRALAERHRRWAWEWSGVRIDSPYRPRPKSFSGVTGFIERCKWLATDPATWRDLLWLVVNIPLGTLLGLLVAAALANGVAALVVTPVQMIVATGYDVLWPLSAAVAVALLGLGTTKSSWPLRWHAQFSRSLLAPSARELEARVGRLTESRAGVVDASAAELRRIERDLHDGAQARLVSVGMSIGLAEQLMATDPAQAQALLVEARESSGQALSELRDLVRGIHPPVLAERGLDGAVQALALAVPLPVQVHIDLPGRPSAPVESAVYFAVAELLANVLKHSSAHEAWIELRYARGALIAVVGDDGIGGILDPAGPAGLGLGPTEADPTAAAAAAVGGLRGIERRLAAFDGILAVTSPSGGPTVITMELPCELSSART